MMIEKPSPSRFSALGRPAITLALVVGAALGLRGSTAEQHHALLSSDLFAHKAKQTKARTRVIVNGTDAQIDDIAYRHHLQVVRRLEGAAVLFANSAELAELAGDAAVDHLSGDSSVRTAMSVSNKSTA